MEQIFRTVSIYALPLLIAITFHEVAHGYVADILGDSTARMHGRLSLNPVKHLDLFGTVILPLILIISGAGVIFGYAKPVPVNAFNLRDPRKGMVYVAAAGPGTNLILALVSGILFRMIRFFSPGTISTIMRDGFYSMPDGGTQSFLVPVALMLVVSANFNVLLALFNLIPIPPLDGGRILTGLLPDDMGDTFAKVERYGMLILVALLFLDPFGIISRIIGPGVHLFSSLFLGI